MSTGPDFVSGPVSLYNQITMKETEMTEFNIDQTQDPELVEDEEVDNETDTGLVDIPDYDPALYAPEDDDETEDETEDGTPE